MRRSGVTAVSATPGLNETKFVSRKNGFMIHLSGHRVVAAVLAVVTVVSVMASGRRQAWADGADRRKSDYIYMEAMRRNALEQPDAYFELIRQSHLLSPDETDVGQELGYYFMMLAGADKNMFDRGYSLMKRHFDAHPDDYYSGIFFGTINDRLGIHDESVRVWTALDSLSQSKSDVTMKLAEAMVATNDTAMLKQAIGVLDRVEVAEGKNLPVTSHKIRAFFTLGDTVSIVSELHSLLDASPRSADNRVYAGDLFMALGRRDSALYYYDRACEVDSTSGLAYYKRAEYYKSTGDSVAYDREVFRALQMNNLELDTKLEILTGYIRELYTDTLQQPRIKSLFSTMLENHPHEPDIHDLYSAYLVAIEDYAGAAEQQEFVIDANPSAEERWRGMQSLYMQVPDMERAAATGERALRYFPESSALYLLTASCYSQTKNYDKAQRYLQKALEYADSADTEYVSQIQCTIGDTYYMAGERDRAFTYYDKALELDPHNMLALNNCAYYLACEGRDLDRAERMSELTLIDNPDSPTSLDTYAWVTFKKADYQKAKEYIDKVILLDDSPSAEVYHHAGDIYFMAGEPERALEFWKMALELEPDNTLLQRKVKHKTYFYK